MTLWGQNKDCRVDTHNISATNCILEATFPQGFALGGFRYATGDMLSYLWNVRAVFDATGAGVITLTPYVQFTDSYMQDPRPFGEMSFSVGSLLELILMLY